MFELVRLAGRTLEWLAERKREAERVVLEAQLLRLRLATERAERALGKLKVTKPPGW